MSQSVVQSFTTEDSSKKKGTASSGKKKIGCHLNEIMQPSLHYYCCIKKTYLVFQAYHALVGLKRFHWSWRRTG